MTPQAHQQRAEPVAGKSPRVTLRRSLSRLKQFFAKSLRGQGRNVISLTWWPRLRLIGAFTRLAATRKLIEDVGVSDTAAEDNSRPGSQSN